MAFTAKAIPFFTQDIVGGFPLKRIVSLFLALVTAALLLCAGAPTAEAAASRVPGNGRPYYIKVNRAMNTVTVYGLDEEGYYTVPVKAMICSVGRDGHATPIGTYSMGGKWPWVHMLDNSYGQYVSQISGNILFHSVCYTRRDPSTLMTEEYNALGERASLGCVRLQSGDAKWIYDNCARGTRITVYDDYDSPGPLGKPGRTVDFITESMDNGWDPTDPRENNPWHELLAMPFSDVAANTWYYGDIKYVHQAGLMTGTGESVFSPDGVVTYLDMAETLYRMSGEEGGGAMDWAAEQGFLEGITGGSINPQGQISRQALVTMLYRYETDYLGRTADGMAVSGFKDGNAVRAYAQDAMGWAIKSGLIQGTSAGTLQPTSSASRAQLAAILHRYDLL